MEFARTALPRLRRQVEADLRRRGLPRERVVAAAVRLLDLGTFRIGNSEYAKEHETFGLTTLLREHVQVDRDHARFTYVGKHGADLVDVVRSRSAPCCGRCAAAGCREMRSSSAGRTRTAGRRCAAST